MGNVYVARHILTYAQVALKVLRPEVAIDAQTEERFLREVRAAAQIGHEGIVKVLDAGRAQDGRLYLAMELLHGETLEERIDRDLESGDRLTLMEWILRALPPLAAAHAQGIVHRDLKPANVFIVRAPDGSEYVKLLDFGLARDTRQKSGTETGITLGTPHYMSPEQAMRPRLVTPASDVWSVGVMMYEVLSGHMPFDGETLHAVVLHAATQQHLALIEREPTLNARLSELVEECLSKEPTERPADASALMERLTPLLEDAEIRHSLQPEDISHVAPVYRTSRVPGPAVASDGVTALAETTATGDFELPLRLSDATEGFRLPARVRRRNARRLVTFGVAVAVTAGGAWVVPRLRDGRPLLPGSVLSSEPQGIAAVPSSEVLAQDAANAAGDTRAPVEIAAKKPASARGESLDARRLAAGNGAARPANTPSAAMTVADKSASVAIGDKSRPQLAAASTMPKAIAPNTPSGADSRARSQPAAAKVTGVANTPAAAGPSVRGADKTRPAATAPTASAKPAAATQTKPHASAAQPAPVPLPAAHPPAEPAPAIAARAGSAASSTATKQSPTASTPKAPTPSAEQHPASAPAAAHPPAAQLPAPAAAEQHPTSSASASEAPSDASAPAPEPPPPQPSADATAAPVPEPEPPGPQSLPEPDKSRADSEHEDKPPHPDTAGESNTDKPNQREDKSDPGESNADKSAPHEPSPEPEPPRFEDPPPDPNLPPPDPPEPSAGEASAENTPASSPFL